MASLLQTYLSFEISLIHNLQIILPEFLAKILEQVSNLLAPHATFWLYFPILHFYHNSIGESTKIVASKYVLAIILADSINLRRLFFGEKHELAKNS